jgi:hypothetical protein
VACAGESVRQRTQKAAGTSNLKVAHASPLARPAIRLDLIRQLAQDPRRLGAAGPARRAPPGPRGAAGKLKSWNPDEPAGPREGQVPRFPPRRPPRPPRRPAAVRIHCPRHGGPPSERRAGRACRREHLDEAAPSQGGAVGTRLRRCCLGFTRRALCVVRLFGDGRERLLFGQAL